MGKKKNNSLCGFQKVNELHYSFTAPGRQNISKTHFAEIKLLLRELMSKSLNDESRNEADNKHHK